MKEPKVIKLEDGGNQLTFKIYPFPATKAEDLMIRIALMTGKNLDIESEMGYRDVIKALVSVPHVEAKALLDELLSEVYKVDGKSEIKFSFDDADGYIDHPQTQNRKLQGELRFFSRLDTPVLPRRAEFLADCARVRGVAVTTQLSPLISRLINGGMASLVELQTQLTLEDAYALDEALLIKNYNSWVAQKSA